MQVREANNDETSSAKHTAVASTGNIQSRERKDTKIRKRILPVSF
jgi:hypothetical protein